ncbi:uncharacterized protein LOC111936041 [Cyanistes caeruleus]|uniref:uncharacterized protein LOC111936041 n=1 Tax=Cyanistes caeruleus TaxID=156563 RepID=UPI000CDA3239|nr:uncharacterized protein LOC111936041 [Cyanistes caeruleus]XP_023792530.1 uncharacterized protein LOC111936041 [Cyanistes caeruleus]
MFGWCRCPLHSLHPFSTKSSTQCWLIPGPETVSTCKSHPLESTFLCVLIAVFFQKKNPVLPLTLSIFKREEQRRQISAISALVYQSSLNVPNATAATDFEEPWYLNEALWKWQWILHGMALTCSAPLAWTIQGDLSWVSWPGYIGLLEGKWCCWRKNQSVQRSGPVLQVLYCLLCFQLFYFPRKQTSPLQLPSRMWKKNRLILFQISTIIRNITTKMLPNHGLQGIKVRIAETSKNELQFTDLPIQAASSIMIDVIYCKITWGKLNTNDFCSTCYL